MKETEAISLAMENIKKKKEAEDNIQRQKEEAKKKLKDAYMAGIHDQVQEKERQKREEEKHQRELAKRELQFLNEKDR